MQRDAFKTLKLLHLAIAGALFLCILLLVIFSRSGAVTGIDTSMERTLQAVAVVLSVAALLAGFNLFKRSMLAARNSPAAGPVRMQQYRNACIVWWAMIEGPGLFAAVCFFLSGNYAFIALAGFHLLLLLLFMPRKDNIIVLLNLNAEDVAVLEGRC